MIYLVVCLALACVFLLAHVVIDNIYIGLLEQQNEETLENYSLAVDEWKQSTTSWYELSERLLEANRRDNE